MTIFDIIPMLLYQLIKGEIIMNVETIVITDKSLIKRLTGEGYNEIHLHLDHNCCQVHYEEDFTEFELTRWLPFYYKIKNMLKEN